jgi:hypothetical protein
MNSRVDQLRLLSCLKVINTGIREVRAELKKAKDCSDDIIVSVAGLLHMDEHASQLFLELVDGGESDTAIALRSTYGVELNGRRRGVATVLTFIGKKVYTSILSPDLPFVVRAWEVVSSALASVSTKRPRIERKQPQPGTQRIDEWESFRLKLPLAKTYLGQCWDLIDELREELSLKDDQLDGQEVKMRGLVHLDELRSEYDALLRSTRTTRATVGRNSEARHIQAMDSLRSQQSEAIHLREQKLQSLHEADIAEQKDRYEDDLEVMESFYVEKLSSQERQANKKVAAERLSAARKGRIYGRKMSVGKIASTITTRTRYSSIWRMYVGGTRNTSAYEGW